MLTRSTLSDVVRYAQLTIDECTHFFVRGACRISGNFAIFCQIFAPTLRDLDAELASDLALERTSTQKRAATKFCSSCNHAGRIYATFLRAACRKFSETLQFFCASCAQILCDPDAGRLSCSDLNAMLTRSTLNDIMQHAQRTMADCKKIFVRGARRKFGRIGNFANFSPDFCANFA